MTPPLRLAGLLASLALPCACGTLVGQPVSGVLQQLQADGARVTYLAPAHCAPPGYRAEFHPAAGVVATITNGFGGGLASRFRIELDAGRSFAFASTSGRVTFPNGAPQADAVVSHTSWLRDSRTVRVAASPDAVMTGQAPPGDRSVYEGDITAHGITANDFSLHLPDAVVDGMPFEFPPLHFSGHPFRYVQDACLR